MCEELLKEGQKAAPRHAASRRHLSLAGLTL